MKRLLFAMGLWALASSAYSQLLSWSPEFPTESSTLVITVDCSKGNQGLFNYSNPNNVYVHTGVTTNLSGSGGQQWLYVNGTTGGQWGGTTAALKAVSLGNNKYQYTITNIRTFFNVPAAETIQKVSILFRDANANSSAVKKQSNSDGSDMYIPIYPSGSQAVKFRRPFLEPSFVPTLEPLTVTTGQTVNAKAVATTTSGTLDLFFNNNAIAGPVTGRDSIVGDATVTGPGTQELVARLNINGNNYYDTVRFYVTPVTVKKPLPSGVVEGVNYYGCSDSVTLVLYAPKKNNCMVIGEFPGSNWAAQTQYQMYMTPDSTYFWLTVKGLTPGTEYAYQYLVDGTIYIADPHTEKILDPWNDGYIPASTYPNLKPYPSNANVQASKNGYISVLQICGPTYNWRNTSFNAPDQRNLIIYELLVRDFVDNKNFQTIIDTIPYLKRLGINAVEFMPLQEFSGNESWGYNPIFYFAPDKAYGTKNKLKELVDSLHSNGIAAILDVVYNQMDSYGAPQGKLYWDATNNRPAANNPWLNPTARHPFNVFEDFNHESTATQYLVNSSLEHWIREYKVDGFRFDLSKGFTQRQTTDVGVWSSFDQSRIDNLNRYYDYIKSRYPQTYMILEHLGVAQEENVLISKGFMPWRKMTDPYNENTMGQTGDKNIGDIMWNYSANGRNAPAPYLVGYMESHDEERLMWKNIQYGIQSGPYNVKDTTTALRQTEAAGAIFFTVPGPKMLWQFGERGYDQSINRCTNGTIDPNGGCRLANKPSLWNYMNIAARRKMYDAWSRMIRLRLSNPDVFNSTPTNFEPNSNNGYVKVLQIGDPNISNMQVVVVVNFAPAAQTKTINFQKTGDWYNYISSDNNATTGSTTSGLNGLTGVTFNLSATSQTINLAAGEYHIYVSGTPCTTAAPAATTAVSYCQNATAVPLTATGTNLLWYTSATGGTGSATAPTPSTATPGTTTWYVSQTVGCEGPRLAITVTVKAATPAPTVTTPVTYCQGSTATPLTATGTSLLWYSVASGGTGSATAPTPSTANAGTTTWYVSQTGECGEGPRAAVSVVVKPTPSAPSVSSPLTYCQGTAAPALTASGSNLLWYSAASGGTGSSTAPVPATNTVGAVSYYVSQTNDGCEGPRAVIQVNTVSVPAAPSVSSPVTYCQGAAAVPLAATGTNLLWYTAATGGTGSSTAPTPTTTAVGSSSYYVSQTSVCESPRAELIVNIVASTPAPVVTTPVTYCQGAAAIPLTATGTQLLWYTAASGGTGSSVAPTPSTTTAGSTTWYVSQTLSCGEGPRASITVTVKATPVAPLVTGSLTYCQGAIAPALTATGTNLLWYTTASGGTGVSTAPVPSTSSLGSTTYYVTQTVDGCESPRASIQVTIVAVPAAPGVTTPVTYCQGAASVALTATGTNLLWYTAATGGTGSSTAPVPSTATAGSVSYFVSQTNVCESPRTEIVVTVVASTPAPTVSSPVTYCQGATASPLIATGTNLLWYTSASGGVGSSTTPTPSTAVVGSVTYYVSQTLSCGEGPRAAIVVTVNSIPAAPSVGTAPEYCQGAAAVALTATGTNLLWYTAASGGSGVANAPVPSTTSAGTTNYYVTQSVSGCESPRASIAVLVKSLPVAPVVSSPVNYCQDAAAVALTATGSGLLWYTAATGGTGSATAPVPATTAGGSTSYYVTQTVNGCEGPRASIVVDVTAKPAAPGVSSASITYCQNGTATALSASGSGLLWFTVATGGTGTSTAPVPATTTAGTTNYYVAASNNCGSGARTLIAVTVTPTPVVPVVTTGTITTTGAVLNWNQQTGVYYILEYKPAGSNNWIRRLDGVAAGTYSFSELTPGTTYEYRLSANCEAANSGQYATGTFATSSRNSTITNTEDGFGLKLTPNPVSGAATLDYIVPGSGMVTLALYSSTGQFLQEIPAGVQAAGQYQLDLTHEFRSLISGVYILRLIQGGKGHYIKFVRK